MAVHSGIPPLRSAFLGTGFMAAVHSHAVRAIGGIAWSCVGSDAEKGRRGAAHLGLPNSHDTLEQALADDAIDVIHVCTPNATHAALAARALEAGKHVICEKPLATSAAAAGDLLRAAELSRGLTAVPFIYRFHPVVREARARVARGDVGRPLTVQASYLQDWLLKPTDDNWRVDAAVGGPSRAFADIGSHVCDLVEFVSGQRIDRVQAVARTVFPRRAGHETVTTEDAVAVVLELDGGLFGTVLVSQVAPGRKNALTIELAGTAESLRFEQEDPETLWIGRRRGSEILRRDPDALSPDAARLCRVPAGHPMGYQDAFDAFMADAYASFGGARPDGLPTFADGARSARVVDAVLESSRTGAWASVPDGGVPTTPTSTV